MPVQTTYNEYPAKAFPGMGADGGKIRDIVPAFNTEVSAEIPFGVGVVRDNSGAYGANGIGAKLPSAAGDLFMGITWHSHAYSNSPNGDLGLVGMKPGAMMNVVRRGRVWVICEDGCTPGQRAWVRYTAAGLGKGTLRATDAGSSTCKDITAQTEWLTTAAALGLAIIEVDATNK